MIVSLFTLSRPSSIDEVRVFLPSRLAAATQLRSAPSGPRRVRQREPLVSAYGQEPQGATPQPLFSPPGSGPESEYSTPPVSGPRSACTTAGPLGEARYTYLFLNLFGSRIPNLPKSFLIRGFASGALLFTNQTMLALDPSKVGVVS